MKVVGFKWLKKSSKRNKKVKIFCISNFFKSAMMILSVLVFLMVFGIINSSFTMNLKNCIENFISSMHIVF